MQHIGDLQPASFSTVDTKTPLEKRSEEKKANKRVARATARGATTLRGGGMHHQKHRPLPDTQRHQPRVRKQQGSSHCRVHVFAIERARSFLERLLLSLQGSLLPLPPLLFLRGEPHNQKS